MVRVTGRFPPLVVQPLVVFPGPLVVIESGRPDAHAVRDAKRSADAEELRIVWSKW
jgi:hypothetical protein